jgi:outer membrane protein OmpA-like peptidoglycan-associated protein
MVYRPYQGDETRFYVNGALGFALNPLRDGHVDPGSNPPGGAPITGQFPVYLSGGLQLAGLIGFNLHIPFTPVQITGNEPAGVGTSGLTDQKATMNDVRLDVRFRGWESNNRKTRVGAFGGFSVGTGTPLGFGGDRAPTAFVALNAEHDFGGFLLAGHAGPHFRPSNSLGGNPDSLFVGDELRYAIGAYLPLRDNRLRLGLEVWGSTGLESLNGESTFFKGRNTTVEWLAQGRFLVSKDQQTFLNVGAGTRLSNGYGSADVRALVSLGRAWGFKDREPPSPPGKIQIRDKAEYHANDSDGDGYPDDIDKCPDLKEDGKPPAPSDGCPAAPDADGDGIPDSIDKCPNDAEDFDKIQDKDGCPETDADNDKVKDKVDKCPENPGPPNKDPSKNGCPVSIDIKSDGSVALLQPIQFALGKATIKPVSYPILKEVATLMNARPNIKIAVHGHTDNAGSHALNVKLSNDRAASVRAYLIGQGIKAERLSSQGFGPDKPIDTNATEAGRAKNRRVEFVVDDGGASKNDDVWE